ncbi:hypothetical protein [Caulobacter sp. FWC2]|uniref:hypothetical protein n=1 Tax=Caulobacter sp. FWC2 TaxID=69664 RepID=UPI000C14C2A5|nr:hypothetical protein [Caulobacter sp. FWC2]PIB91460.1 hypothetical protein CSW62_07635 [Caulobacter sp. FWC2]
MATYTIRIYNQSAAAQSYVIFMAPPAVASTGGATPVFANAWVTFANLTPGSWDSVVYTENSYAYWSSVDRLSLGAVVDSGGVMAVNTATCDTVTFTNTGMTGFKSLTSPGQASNGSFSIVAGTDFTPLNGFVFGLAQPDGSPIPAPVATFSALPNETYNVTPVIKFYVTDGAYAAGEVIDVAQVSNSAAVDFTGTPYSTATVLQHADGSFAVSYS